jgi:pimeloyl-ACP methyl ester carboxylesterase
MIPETTFRPDRLIFIHGLMGSSQGVKATLLRERYPKMLTPDFPGSLEERLSGLEAHLGRKNDWTIVGSSLGGLMGAIYTTRQPCQVRKLVLLAPALVWPDFAQNLPDPIDVPTVIYHGRQDDLIPLGAVRLLAEQVFHQLTFNVVDDDHGLYKTVHALDWGAVLK